MSILNVSDFGFCNYRVISFEDLLARLEIVECTVMSARIPMISTVEFQTPTLEVLHDSYFLRTMVASFFHLYIYKYTFRV